MKMFSKRETLTENIALMALMSAINIIICVLLAFLNVFSIFLILVLPLISALVEIYCKDRYYLIYAFASLGLSLIATLWNIETTIFYLVPSLFTGYLFGLLAKKNIPSIYSILLTSLVQMGLTMGEIPLINFIFDVNIINTFKTFFKLNESTNVDVIIPSFIFTISLIEMSLSYLIISNELIKLKIEEYENDKFDYLNCASLLLFSILSILFSLFSLETSYLFFMISLYFVIFIIGKTISRKHIPEILFFVLVLIASIILYALFNGGQSMKANVLLLNIIPSSIGLIDIIFLVLKRRHKNIK